MVLNPDIDCFEYVNVNNPNARDAVLSMIDQNGLIDVFRELHFDKKKTTKKKKKNVYTWRRTLTSRRVWTFFLISEDLLTDVSDCKIIPGYRTDHSIVSLDIDFGKFKKGRSYWRFNNSLLHDKDYINQIKQLIIEIKRRYAADIQLYEGTIGEIPND